MFRVQQKRVRVVSSGCLTQLLKELVLGLLHAPCSFGVAHESSDALQCGQSQTETRVLLRPGAGSTVGHYRSYLRFYDPRVRQSQPRCVLECVLDCLSIAESTTGINPMCNCSTGFLGTCLPGSSTICTGGGQKHQVATKKTSVEDGLSRERRERTTFSILRASHSWTVGDVHPSKQVHAR